MSRSWPASPAVRIGYGKYNIPTPVLTGQPGEAPADRLLDLDHREAGDADCDRQRTLRDAGRPGAKKPVHERV